MNRLLFFICLNIVLAPAVLAQQSSSTTPQCRPGICFQTQQARNNYAFSHGCTFNNPTTGGGSGSTDPSSCPVDGSNSSTLSNAGNPIDVGTGNKFQIERDYRDALPDGLQFVRSYNSFQGNKDVGMGHGWRHNWLRRIREDKSGLVTAFRPDGAHFIFQKESTYVAPPGVVDRLEKTAQGWRYLTGRGEVETYDATGDLQELRLPSGRTHTLQYGNDKQLVAVTDDRGRRLHFSYSGKHVSGVTLPSNEVLSFTYDDASHLIGIYRRPVGLLAAITHWRSKPTTRYHYDDARFPNALTGLDDATGARYASWAYDAIGRAIMSQHGDGAEKITINYRDETTAIITNAVGHVATYTLEPMGDGRRRVVAITGKAGNTCPQLRQRNHFNQNGFLDLAADNDQQGRIMQRNARGLIETEYDGVHVAADNSWTPAEGSLKITRTWHAQLPLVTTATTYRYRANQWQPVLQNTYAYDARGNVQSDTTQDLLSSAAANSAPTKRQWTYTRQYHDAAQRNLSQLSISDPLGHTTQLNYDALGRLTTTANALQQITAFTDYTAAYLPQHLTLPNGQSIALHYDDQHRITAITRGDNTEREETRIDYLANGLVSHLHLANGNEFYFTYNAARQLTSIKNGRGETQTLDPSKLNGDWLNRTLSDASGKLALKQQRRQDEWGRLLKWLGNSNQLTELTYNEAGDLAAVHEGAENTTATSVANTDKETPRTTQAKYDTLHRLTELIDAAGYSTQVNYSHSGQIETVVDANKNATHYVRNGFGEVLQENNPARGNDTYRYDALGNPIQHNQTQLHYDALNRLTAIDAPGEADDIHYTYDQTDAEHGNGIQQLTRIETRDQIIDYQYDNLGRRIQERSVDKEGKQYTHITILKYRYLAGNRLDQLTYPDGSEVHYHYDNERISDVTYTDSNDPAKAEKPLLKKITYAPFGGPQQWTYGNGLTQTIGNDLDGRVQLIELRNGANPAIWAQGYGYDRYNNIKKIERAGSDQTKQTQQFDYDLLDRLTGEKSPTQAVQYDYDPVGNRLNDIENGKPTKLTYTEGNRLTQRGDVKITLDGRGNLIEETEVGTGPEPKKKTSRRFDYNSNNRPINFYKDGQLAAQYHYNANGLRDRKTLVNATQAQPKPQTQITQFTYAPDTRLLSAGSNTQTTHYIWLGGAPIAQIEKPAHPQQAQATITYLHTDHLLTPRIATNEQQKIVWHWQSDAFGETAAENDPDKDGQRTQIQLRFPGQYADEESGLYYNVFRYYDPKNGRYTQSDPIGLGGGVNSFTYVGGGPLASADSLGLFTTYWGGAGLDGSYIADQVSALEAAGVSNVHIGTGSGGTIFDAVHVNLFRYQINSDFFKLRDGIQKNPCPEPGAEPEQFNLIGYSYGSLVAAQTANYYANHGQVVDNLVLIGSPIDAGFLASLQANPNIKHVIIKNLTGQGDPISAGMSEGSLLSSTPTLIKQMITGTGHFYYAPDNNVGKSRRADFANEMFSSGLK